MRKKILLPISLFSLVLLNVVVFNDYKTVNNVQSLHHIYSAYAGNGEIGWLGSVVVNDDKQEAVDKDCTYWGEITGRMYYPDGTYNDNVTVNGTIDGTKTVCRNKGKGCAKVECH